MSDGSCKLSHGGDVPVCPTNGQVTRPVPRVTVEALIAHEHRAELTPQPYFFCDAPACDTVYVSALGDHLITKDQLVVRVGIKETEDPIPLCYCFGYDRAHIRDDVRARGETDIQREITARVKAGECRCAVANPSGGCCLGRVSRAIKEALALEKDGRL